MDVSIFQYIVVLSAILQFGFSFNFRMEILPDNIDELSPANNVTVSCLTSDSFSATREVLVMEIGKSGENPIAIIQQNSNLTLRHGLGKDFLADGSAEGNSSLSFIRLTLMNPRCKDAGTYFCLVYFIDEDGAFKEEKVEANLSVDKHDIAVMLEHLKTRMASLEKRVEIAEDTVNNQAEVIAGLQDRVVKQDSMLNDSYTKLNDQVRKLNGYDSKLTNQDLRLGDQERALTLCNNTVHNIINDKIAQHETTLKSHQNLIDTETGKVKDNLHRIEYIEDLTRNQTRIITNSKSHATTVEAFTALYDYKNSFDEGDVLVFSKVQLKEGSGYDENTGIFKAPRAGIYVFHLTIATKKSSAMDIVDIAVNDKPQAKVFAYDTDLYPEQSSVSCTVRLQEGDTVKVIVLNRSRYISSLYKDPYYSVFTGYLLREL